jgi:hypothetical protein
MTRTDASPIHCWAYLSLSDHRNIPIFDLKSYKQKLIKVERVLTDYFALQVSGRWVGLYRQ